MESTTTKQEVLKKGNRMKAGKGCGILVNKFWDSVFEAQDKGIKVCSFTGGAVNVFLEAMDLLWMNNEAVAALVAARHQEKAPQQASEDYGYNRELCSYARTHMGCALFAKNGFPADLPEGDMARSLPNPDMIVNCYGVCNTGMLWDEMQWRLMDKKVPRFNIYKPFVNYDKGDHFQTGRLVERDVEQIAEELMLFIKFLEEQTGKPFNWDKFRQIMGNVKKTSELRLSMFDLLAAKPAPATFFDCSIIIAGINFLPQLDGAVVKVYENFKAEIEERIRDGVAAIPNEKYRIWWEGIMNWNKLGWLSEKFASYGANVLGGRYNQMSFWARPDLIDPSLPEKELLKGIALCYMSCAMSHAYPQTLEECNRWFDKYQIDGIVTHVSRTCRAFTTVQPLMSELIDRQRGIPTATIEGDIADETFFKDEMVNSRLEALFEQIDARRGLRG